MAFAGLKKQINKANQVSVLHLLAEKNIFNPQASLHHAL